MRRVLPLLCSALLTSTALAQTPPLPPTSQPAPSTQPMSAKDVLDDMLKPGAADKLKPLTPIQGQIPINKGTINPIVPGQRPLTLRREGSYVTERTGRLTKSADGKYWEFNFEADANTLQDPPMVLLPNLTLMMVQDELKGASRDVRFRVSGMVTEYVGRNYLLLTKAIVVMDNAGIGGG